MKTWTIHDLKQQGRENMNRSYWKAVLAGFVLSIAVGGSGFSSFSNTVLQPFAQSHLQMDGPIVGAFGALLLVLTAVIAFISVAGLAINIFLFKPLGVGARRFFIMNRVEDAKVAEIGVAFRTNFLNVVKTEFLRALYVFLWSLLLIIPGLVKGYEYRMVPYILAENPSIDSREAFRLSKTMMKGEKWNAFVLDLSFIGWYILASLTFGLLNLFYVNPYHAATSVELYETLKAKMFDGAQSEQPAAGAASAAETQAQPEEQPKSEEPKTEA